MGCTKEPEHVLVRFVVSSTDHQIRIRIFSQNPFDDHALVHINRTNFEILLSDQNLHRKFRDNAVLQVILAFFCLKFSKTKS